MPDRVFRTGDSNLRFTDLWLRGTNSPTGKQTSHKPLSENVEDCYDEIKFYQLIIVTCFTQLR